MLALVHDDDSPADTHVKWRHGRQVLLPGERATRRRRSDFAGLAGGLMGFGLSSLWVGLAGDPSPSGSADAPAGRGVLSLLPTIERAAFVIVNRAPDALYVPLWVVMQAGSFFAVPVFATLALAARRPHLARALAVSGTIAWSLGKVLKPLVPRGRPDLVLADVVIRGDPAAGLGYPSGHAAVAAALMTVASPYLSKPYRRVGWSVAVLTGLARVYVGAHLPLDVVGGFSLGLAVGSCVNLVLGAPEPPVDQDRVGSPPAEASVPPPAGS